MRSHLFGGLVGTFLVAVPGDADVEAVLCELDGRRLADARIGAGDDCDGHVTAAYPERRRTNSVA
jgi:hypothetical protein